LVAKWLKRWTADLEVQVLALLATGIFSLQGLPGSLWAVTLSSIQASVQEYINSSEYADYQALRDYTNYPCSKMSYDEIEALRPVFDPNAYNLNLTDLDYPPFAHCPRWGDLRPIWNTYGMCMYELVRTEAELSDNVFEHNNLFHISHLNHLTGSFGHSEQHC